MSEPARWIENALAAARDAGRDFEARPLSDLEHRGLLTMYRLSYAAAHAARGLVDEYVLPPGIRWPTSPGESPYVDLRENLCTLEPLCDHGFIGACADCDGCGQQESAR